MILIRGGNIYEDFSGSIFYMFCDITYYNELR